jgi:hypothetical protein
MPVLFAIFTLFPITWFFKAMLTAPTAYVVMVAVGILHSLEPMVPPLGFLTTWMIIWILALIRPIDGSTLKELFGDSSS